jgi:hypothetical protein
MKTRKLIIVNLVAALTTVVLFVMMLWANGGMARAQGPNPPTGDGNAATATPLAPTGDGQPSGTPNRPAPPRETIVESPSNPALSFSYYKVIGTAFQPRESTSTYAYTTNGCLYQNGGTTLRFQAPLILPEGSVIKYVRFYYMDTAATDMTVWLTRYEPGQANLDLTSVQSTGSGGYGTTLSPLITQTVDMATYAYVLTWGTSVATSANQLCGVRIAYYAPPSVFGAFLPAIQKNP